jgi:hypothetical protein
MKDKTKKKVVAHLKDDIKNSKMGIGEDKRLIKKIKDKVKKKRK